MSAATRKPRERVRIDATPAAHSFLDAMAVASFKLACGCRIRPGKPDDAVEAMLVKCAGSLFECDKHGEQVITRVTSRLVGWREPPKGRWRP